MKIRNDFVTNSSSSSFIITTKSFDIRCKKCGSLNTQIYVSPEGENSIDANITCKDCSCVEDISQYDEENCY